ncbi:MAG: sodium:solute symporter [Mariniblastus sp.]
MNQFPFFLAQVADAAEAAPVNAGFIRLVVILIYLASLLLLGYLASRMFRGTKNDYLLASHSIGPFLLLMSIFGTTMTAFALVGSSGEAFKKGIGVYGMLASSSGIIHSLCFFVIGIKIYGFGRKYGYTTQIQFFRDRLDSDFIGLLLFPILVGLIIPYLLIGVIAGGTVIQVMTAGAFPDLEMFQSLLPDGTVNGALSGGLPPWLGSALICGVVLIYVFFGGMRGTAWANAFQTIVFMVLGVVTFVLLANKLGNGETFFESLKNITDKVQTDKLTRKAMSQTHFFSYLLIPLSVGMFPHLFQHWLTAKSSKSFKLPVVCHPIFIMIVWVPCVLIGVWATTLQLPGPIAANANSVLPFLVKTKIGIDGLGGAVLAGLLTAGILAAIMSSLDSQFLCIGSIFTNDIFTHYLGKDRFSDKSQVWIARMFVILIVGVTYYLSLQDTKSVFTLGVWCFSGFAALFPLIFASLYWKRLTAAGALSGILAMVGSWVYLFRESEWGSNGDYLLAPFGADFGVMPVVGIFICSTLAMVITSFVTKPPSKETLAQFFD